MHEEIYPNTNIIAYIRKYALVDDLFYLTSGEAWQMVLDEMRRVCGSYGVPSVSNEIVQRVINAVGWKDICLSDNIAVVRGQFFKIYDSFVQKEKEKILHSFI